MHRVVAPGYLDDAGPRKMALKYGILYVSCQNNTVNSIDLKHENITQLRAPAAKFKNGGYGIAITSNSIIYVADYDNDMIRYIKEDDQVIDIILTKRPRDIVVDSNDAIYYIYQYQFIVKYYNNRITYLGSENIYNCLTEMKIDSQDNIFLLDPCNVNGTFIWKIPYSDQSKREQVSLDNCMIGSKITAITINSEDNVMLTLVDKGLSYLYLISPNQPNITQLCLPNKRMNISGMVVDKSNDYLYISDLGTNVIYEVTDYCRATGPNVCTVYPADETSSLHNDKFRGNLYALFALLVILPIFAFVFYYYNWCPREQNNRKAKKPALLTDPRRIQ